MDSKLTLLEDLAATTKTSQKLSLLMKYKDDEEVARILLYALDPYRSYHIRKIPPFKTDDNNTIDLSDGLDFLDYLNDRKLTGNAAISSLQEILSGMSADNAEVLCRVMTKNLKCGVSTATANKVFDDLIPTYPCLLGDSFSIEKVEKNFTFPCIAQLKSDGIRVNVFCDGGDVTFRGRSGKHIYVNGDIIQEFADLGNMFSEPVVFDGEMIVLNDDGTTMSRKKGNGIINKAIKGTISDKECSMIAVNLWDIIPTNKFFQYYYNKPYQERLTQLAKAISERASTKYSIIDSRVVDSLPEAEEYFAECLSSGEEGIMLKDGNSVWENKRSKQILKFKANKECELVVAEWVEGTGKYKGMLGSLICKDKSGQLVVGVGSGFSDHDRKTIGKDVVGKVLSVRYNEVIYSESNGKYSLFLPRFLEVRSDKDQADHYDHISKM